MYPTTNDGRDKTDNDQTSSTKKKISNISQSKATTPPNSPGPTLYTADDNSNPDELSTNHSVPISKPAANLQSNFSSTDDRQRDTPDQQRRRNSSIAKLLGGKPLNNQQYEEINQQILDDQSAQNLNQNGDNGFQRSRSSITRTLLMNSERNNSQSANNSKVQNSSPTASSTDFEYLIRRELDNEHSNGISQRNDSNLNVFKTLNPSNHNNVHTPTPNRTKRKRSTSKLTNNLMQNGVSVTSLPFKLHEPFELNSSNSKTANDIPSIVSLHRDQNDLIRFNPTNHHSYQNQSKFSLPVNNLSRHGLYHKAHLNAPFYNQFSPQITRPVENQRSASFSYVPCSSTMKYFLPAASFSHHVEHQDSQGNNIIQQNKLNFDRSGPHEVSRQRSYSNLSIPSDATSAELCTPLKKRLLSAYKNEQTPTSSL